eukprot:1217008-Amphidinium_carterae.1
MDSIPRSWLKWGKHFGNKNHVRLKLPLKLKFTWNKGAHVKITTARVKLKFLCSSTTLHVEQHSLKQDKVLALNSPPPIKLTPITEALARAKNVVRPRTVPT